VVIPLAARGETFAIPGARPPRPLLRGRDARAPRNRTDALRPRASSEGRRAEGVVGRTEGGGRRTEGGRKRTETSSQLGAKGGVNANWHEGNTEDYGAHACVGEKLLPGAPALRGLELRQMGFCFVVRIGDTTSYKICTYARREILRAIRLLEGHQTPFGVFLSKTLDLPRMRRWGTSEGRRTEDERHSPVKSPQTAGETRTKSPMSRVCLPAVTDLEHDRSVE